MVLLIILATYFSVTLSVICERLNFLNFHVLVDNLIVTNLPQGIGGRRGESFQYSKQIILVAVEQGIHCCVGRWLAIGKRAFSTYGPIKPFEVSKPLSKNVTTSVRPTNAYNCVDIG